MGVVGDRQPPVTRGRVTVRARARPDPTDESNDSRNGRTSPPRCSHTERMRGAPRTVLVAVGALALAACGSTDSPAAQAPATTAAPTETPAVDEPGAEPSEQSTGTAEPEVDDVGTLDTDATDSGQDEAPPPAEPAVEGDNDAPAEPPEEPAPEPAPDPAGAAWPDDGCSADNSATPTDVAAGPAPELEIRTESAAASPLPDLAVRRINCGGGWVNLKNELPADRPVLVWFWAPH